MNNKSNTQLEVHNPNGRIWSAEWFLYENENVSGPHTAKNLFHRKFPPKTGTILSRKGFKSWHPFEAVRRLYLKESSQKERRHKPLSSHINIQTNPRLFYYHNKFKKRLRIGQLKDPVPQGIWSLLTLGLFSYVCLVKSAREIQHHLGSSPLKLSKLWWCFIPPFHIILFYRIGILVRQMERQNHYMKTSPHFAAWAGILPPLGIYYLQKAMNHHWITHIRRAYKERT